MSIRIAFAVATAVGALLRPSHADAQLTGSNGQATMTVISEPRYRAAPNTPVADRFAVRVVDPAGRPIPGLVIDMFANFCNPLPLLPNQCPSYDVYGQFDGGMQNVTATTDADGIAASPPFTAGSVPGVYEVAISLFPSLHPENASVAPGSINLGVPIVQTTLSGVPIGAGFTGTWFDPAQSGHGLMVEVLSENRILAYWFSFTPGDLGDPAQTWFGGVGDIDGDVGIIQADYGRFGAWIPNFDPTQFQIAPWGDLFFAFDDCNHGRVEFSAVQASWLGSFGIGSMPLTRLTQPAGVACP